MNSCENCGNNRVRKVSAVVDEQIYNSYSSNGHSISGSTPLADKLSIPRVYIIDYLVRVVASFIGGILLGFCLVAIFGAILDKTTSINVVNETGGRSELNSLGWMLAVFMVPGMCIALARWNRLQWLFATIRARRRRLKTYKREWYCGACDSVFIPGESGSVRPSDEANDWS